MAQMQRQIDSLKAQVARYTSGESGQDADMDEPGDQAGEDPAKLKGLLESTEGFAEDDPVRVLLKERLEVAMRRKRESKPVPIQVLTASRNQQRKQGLLDKATERITTLEEELAKAKEARDELAAEVAKAAEEVTQLHRKYAAVPDHARLVEEHLAQLPAEVASTPLGQQILFFVRQALGVGQEGGDLSGLAQGPGTEPTSPTGVAQGQPTAVQVEPVVEEVSGAADASGPTPRRGTRAVRSQPYPLALPAAASKRNSLDMDPETPWDYQQLQEAQAKVDAQAKRLKALQDAESAEDRQAPPEVMSLG